MITREEIIKTLVKDKEVLDLGSSWGDFGDFIKQYAEKYHSLDVEKGSDYQQDLNKPFDLERKFDIIVAGELIEHLENRGVFLENVKKHLKDNGIFFLTTPNPTSFRFFVYGLINREPDFEGHIKYFTYDALKLILEKYFRVEKMGFNHYTTNNPNKHKLSWKIKFFIECLIGDIIQRLSPDIYAICKLR